MAGLASTEFRLEYHRCSMGYLYRKGNKTKTKELKEVLGKPGIIYWRKAVPSK